MKSLAYLLSLILVIGSGRDLLYAQQEKSQPAAEEEAQPPAEEKAQPAPEEKEEEVPTPPARRRARPSLRAPERRLLPAPAAQAEMVSLNFNRADLVEVIHVLAQHLKLTYTIDPDVKGSVTIYSAEPLKKEDLFPVFHQVLRMNGAVAVKAGDLYRITSIKEGKALVRPVAGKEDSYALQVVPVRFFSVAEMKRLLTPFITPGGEIMDYPRGNFLIIMDLPSNIQRLVEIKDLIDIQTFAGTRMEIYLPKVASAEELAAEMSKIMQAYASSATQAEGFAAQFLSIPRTNQLLVISHSEAAWNYVKRWLERIDVIAEGPGRRIFVYPVENGKAVDLADTLTQALGIAPTARREAPRTLQDLHRGGPTAPGGTGAPRPQLPSLGGGSAGSQSQSLYPALRYEEPPVQSPETQGAYAAAPAPVPPRPAIVPPAAPPTAPPRPEARPEARPQEQLRIVADPATNSLIVYGTAQEFQNIKNILKDLDIIPRQVLMDVLVAEVQLTEDLSFGIEYEILRRAGTGVATRIFGQDFGSTGAVRSGLLGAAPEGGGITQFGKGISGVIGRSNAVRAFINALMTDSRIKVLSTPSVLATDNRPARIQVGSEIPILSSQQVTATTTGVLVNNVQYRNTGVILTIIPQVNSQGLVNLQVKQEVSKVGSANFGATGSPSFDTRDAETTAVVQDGETLVIGGIITENKTRDRSGIPYLMDIPVLGRFFGTTTDHVDRTELVMLITPHVVRNLEEARGVTDEFKQKLSTVAREIERMKMESQQDKKP